MKKQLKIFVAVFLIGALIISTFLFCTKKENIHNATINDLDNVQEIGEVLSDRIYLYVQTNGVENVDELKGHIEYVGEVRLKELKKIYK